MIPKSYLMQFRAGDAGDMAKLSQLCQILRAKGTCFSIEDTTIRGQPGYEVFWLINPERHNPDDRRFRRYS